MGVRFWNRSRGREEQEQVYGALGVRLLYENPIGLFFTHFIFALPWFSRLIGRYYSSCLSTKKISFFIKKFRIPMDQYEEIPFQSFNEFFIRKFKKGQRTFPSESQTMGAPCEGRYLAFERIKPEQKYPVKGKDLSVEELLDGSNHAKDFLGGSLVIARLCPVDYHRYHYPDSGNILERYQISGRLHSVNPIPLSVKSDIFITNERSVSILDTENFGKIAYIEVGALCVGKIVQTHDERVGFQRGEEKGYFLFGGSTVILLTEPGRLKFHSDLLQKTKERQECFVQLGEAIAGSMQ